MNVFGGIVTLEQKIELVLDYYLKDSIFHVNALFRVTASILSAPRLQSPLFVFRSAEIALRSRLRSVDNGAQLKRKNLYLKAAYLI